MVHTKNMQEMYRGFESIQYNNVASFAEALACTNKNKRSWKWTESWHS